MRPPLQITAVHWRQKARVQQLYHQTACVRTRIRAQMALLSLNGHSVSEIAQITQQSDDTVRRWLHRFIVAGYAGLKEELHPGRPAELTPAIENFLLDCLKRSPRIFNIQCTTWTTATLAEVVQTKFAVHISDECMRQHLQYLDMVCRCPTWTIKHLAKEQPGYAQKRRYHKAVKPPAAWGGCLCAGRSGNESLSHLNPHLDAARPAAQSEGTGCQANQTA